MYQIVNQRPQNIAAFVLRLEDNASIPFDPDNRDYADYLAWLAEGNVPTPADEQPTE